MRSLAFMILAFSPLITSPTLAQESCATDLQVEHRFQLTLNDKDGWWFSGAQTRLMLSDLLELENSKNQIGLMGERILLADKQQAELRSALASSEQAQATFEGILETSARRAREAEEAEGGLFAGKPYVWALGGTVLGVLTVVLVLAVSG